MSINLLLILFVLIVVSIIAFILVQKGTGATAGSAFGSGASSTVFGAKGSGNFLTKTTMILAFLFFAISMMMAISANREFTASATGEVDLGVMGTLDNSTDSDVPEMISSESTNANEASDVPVLNEQTVVPEAGEASDIPAAVVDEVSSMQNAIEDKVDEAKAKVDGAIDNVKGAVEDAKDDVKNAKDALESGIEEVKDSLDGEG